MTAEQQVKAKYPDAHTVSGKFGGERYVMIVTAPFSMGAVILAEGWSAAEAWSDAASRLAELERKP